MGHTSLHIKAVKTMSKRLSQECMGVDVHPQAYGHHNIRVAELNSADQNTLVQPRMRY
jgi:hypothetical protein